MKISLIGTGHMGYPMARNLSASGHELTVFNRTKSKAQPLKQFGIKISPSSRQAVTSADVVITMLHDAKAIHETILSDEVKPCLAEKTVIQMGTISPTESKDIENLLQQLGGEYIEAPVMGSVTQVEKKQLIIMVGCVFHAKPATDSRASLPPIPDESCH